MIKTVELSKIFRTDEVETTALSGINLEVTSGEFAAIMGPSGCGKSTLLNLIGLLDNPTTGNYFFNGKEVSTLNEKQRARLRKRNIGFIFQNFNLIEELSVFDNIELPLIYMGVSTIERKIKVEEVMDKMQIGHRRNHFPLQLSGGQQQRVAVARAVVSDPLLVLADEPTGNLDSARGEEVMNMLARLNEEGTTVIIVTHSLRDAEFAHRVIRHFDGQVINEDIKARKIAALVY